MKLPTLSPSKLKAPYEPNGHGPNGRGSNGNGHSPGDPDSAPESHPPSRRNSPWPFLLDLGLVIVLLGLIIFRHNALIVVGALVALINWMRDARTDYSQLSE